MKIKFDTILKLFLATAAIGVGISYSKLYLFHIFFAIIIFAYLYLIINKQKIMIKKLPTGYHYFFYLWFLWYFITILWSINITYSLRYLFYIAIGSILSLIIIYYIDNKEKQKGILKYLSFVFLFEISLSLLEGFNLIRWPISPYSPYCFFFDRKSGIPDNLSQAALAYINSTPTGFQWNPNNLAVVMLIILPFFIFYSNRLIKYIGIISIVLILIQISSRGCIFALLIVVLLFTFFYSRKKIKQILLVSFGIFLILIINLSGLDLKIKEKNQKIYETMDVFSVFTKYIKANINNKDTSGIIVDSNEKKSSINIRAQLIKNGLIALKESNGLGVGAGGSIAVQENAVVKAENIKSMHNFWIEMLVDSGILFTIVFFIWYFGLIIKLYRISRNTTDHDLKYYASASSLSLSGFLVAAISASSVIYLLPVWLLFGFSISIINNYKNYPNDFKLRY